MKSRRFKESYRIVESGDGRLSRRRAEYAGDYYAFSGNGPAPRKRLIRAGLWVGLYWLSALSYLRTARATSRCAYALIPFLLGLMPGIYAVMGLYTLARAPVRMTIVQKENGPGRLTRSALGAGIFSAVGCMGCAVRVSLGGLWGSAWHEPALTLAAAVFAWLGFAWSRRDYRALEKA